jgi:hypothetical protein
MRGHRNNGFGLEMFIFKKLSGTVWDGQTSTHKAIALKNNFSNKLSQNLEANNWK